MVNLLLSLLAATSVNLSTPFPLLEKESTASYPVIQGISLAALVPSDELKQVLWLQTIKNMLQTKTTSMSPAVINKVLKTLKCSNEYDVEHRPVLTVIDFSLPSSQKRLWVFDLDNQTMLYHTYVTHGIKSGFLNTTYFSNRHNSKASSIGVFKTKQSYYGRHGMGLRLNGLEPGFNNQASGRAIVMHGSWYAEEPFIKKYGRAGRSWGCPAIPNSMVKPIIQTIKDDGLLVAYYPSEKWILQSKYLHCDNFSSTPIANIEPKRQEPIENRDDIVYVEGNNNNNREENEPIMVISADHYMEIFKSNVPLKRMLRRQIDKMEYIALNRQELQEIITKHPERLYSENKDARGVHFVIPKVKYANGRYTGTELKIISPGKLKTIAINENIALEEAASNNDMIHFEDKPSRPLKTTDQFIRWLGL